MRSVLLIFIFFSGIVVQLAAQQKTDNPEQQIYALPDDSAKINRLNELAGKQLFENPEHATAVIAAAIAISQKINYPLGLSVAYGLQANLLFYQMKLDSCKGLVDKAYALVLRNNSVPFLNQRALLINRYAAIYQQRQKYDSAVSLYLESASIFTSIKEDNKTIYSYYNLSGIYNFLTDYDKAIFYARETRRIAARTNDSVFIIRSLIAMGDAFVSLKAYDSVFLTAQTGLKLANLHNMTFAIGKFHALLGSYYTNRTETYDTAIVHFNAALASFYKINTGYDIAMVLQGLGEAYLKKKDYSNAAVHLKKATALADSLRLDQVLRMDLLDLVTAEEMLGNEHESHQYLKQYLAVNDSVQNRNNRKIANELEIKYQTQKKEALLLDQQKTIRQKNLLNYLLAGMVLSTFLISFLLYRTYHQKQTLQQQRISELEIEKKLSATEAVLKGEDQERTRLAKDLHDGLGGMLSGIKYSMSTMRGNLIMTPENTQAFERGMDMIDSSIQEMRRVAHNMMPEALVKFGLDTALKDFCNDINQTGALKINYQSIGMEDIRIDQTTAVTIYRIVQELVNNSIKHAAAKTAIVQLTKTNGHLSVTVEDDGTGFDTSLLKNSKGIGWSNIQNRVDFLKGKLDISSQPAKGTSVLIEINT